MAENSIVDSGVKGMSCSTPVNPFKSGNPFTPTSDLSLDRSVNLESSSRRVHSANPFASENQLNNSGTYSSNPFALSESEPSNNSADLFTNRRKFSKYAADIRSMSSLAYQDLSPDTQERFAVQHFIDAIKDQDDRLRLRRDKPKTMDEALTLACELEAFRLLDGDWRGSSSKVRSVDEVGKEPDLLRAQLDMLRSDIQMQQQRQETQQVALQELVQQIQQLSQTMTLNTSGSPNAPRYPNRNGQCWDCKEFGHYRRNCPKRKSQDRVSADSGNVSRVSPKGPGDA
ncbi:uncharacterized protein LOC144651166 [Oculina patagonica]